MPTHVHLLTFPDAEASSIDQLLRAIKRPFSFRVKQQLEASGSPLLPPSPSDNARGDDVPVLAGGAWV